MSTIAIDNFKPSAGGTSFGIEGIAKFLFEYDQSTPAVSGDINISSVTDDGTGVYTPNFTNSFSAADYSVFGQANVVNFSRGGGYVGHRGASTGSSAYSEDNRATGSYDAGFRASADASNSSAALDISIQFQVGYGDLA